MNVVIEREVERVAKVYLFGHYDSRGGASLVVAENHFDAVNAYLNVFDPEGVRAYVRERDGGDAASRAVTTLSTPPRTTSSPGTSCASATSHSRSTTTSSSRSTAARAGTDRVAHVSDHRPLHAQGLGRVLGQVVEKLSN